MHQIAIEAVSLTKKYRSGQGELVVFRNLGLKIEAGAQLALVGESGAGKSTLLHLLGGLDTPSEGTVLHGSRNIFALDERARAEFRNRELGFVWQNQSLLPEFTALENVMMPLLIRGTGRIEAQRLARERLDEVGLADRATHRAGELSGGEQQRVVLARALAAGPKTLLADEPTGNLDHQTGEMIISLLRELQRVHGFTAIYVTHNLAFARRCDRILELRKGELIPLLPASATADRADEKDGSNYV